MDEYDLDDEFDLNEYQEVGICEDCGLEWDFCSCNDDDLDGGYGSTYYGGSSIA